MNVTPPGDDPLPDLLGGERLLASEAEEERLVDKARTLVDVGVRGGAARRHRPNGLAAHRLGQPQLDRPCLEVSKSGEEGLGSRVESEDLRFFLADLGVSLEHIDSEPDYGVVLGGHPLDTPIPIAFRSTVVEIHPRSTGEREILQPEPVDYPACVAMGDGYGVFMQRSDVLGGEPQERISGRYLHEAHEIWPGGFRDRNVETPANS